MHVWYKHAQTNNHTHLLFLMTLSWFNHHKSSFTHKCDTHTHTNLSLSNCSQESHLRSQASNIESPLSPDTCFSSPKYWEWQSRLPPRNGKYRRTRVRQLSVSRYWSGPRQTEKCRDEGGRTSARRGGCIIGVSGVWGVSWDVRYECFRPKWAHVVNYVFEWRMYAWCVRERECVCVWVVA